MTASQTPLPDTLALRLQHLRQARDMTPRRLAEQAHVPQALVEDIEAGIELFLSEATRLRLARVLRVRPDILLEVEKRPAGLENHTSGLSVGRMQILQQLVKGILDNPQRHHACPDCAGRLNVRIFQREDVNGNPLTMAKIHCTQCLFRIEAG